MTTSGGGAGAGTGSAGRERRYPATLAVARADVDVPVDRFLRRHLRADPPHVQKLLRQRRVGWTPGPGAVPTLLAAGDRLPAEGLLVVAAADPARRPPPAPNRRVPFAVLHEDVDLAVVDKPAGITMHPGPRHGSDTLLNGLLARWPELAALGRERNHGLVHRLDRETSGVLVVARTTRAFDALTAAFRERRVEKRYLAFVDARAATPRDGVRETPIAGRPARTEFTVLELRGPVARLAARPVSGRTHQIRIHLAERGTPVLGDERHGSGRDELTARLYLKRLALHAERLAFTHPFTGAALAFERPLPKDMRHAWRRVRKLFPSDG